MSDSVISDATFTKKDVRALAREAAPYALREVFKLMLDPKVSASVRLEAAKLFIEHAAGKPAQAVAVASFNGEVTPEQRAQVREFFRLLPNGFSIDKRIGKVIDGTRGD